MSGLCINRKKSWLLALGMQRHPRTGDTFGVPWIQPGDRKKYLGSIVGLEQLEADEIAWDQRIKRMKMMLAAWRPARLAIHERAEVIQVFAAGSACHLAAFSSPSPQQLKKITTAFSSFMWNNQGQNRVAGDTCAGLGEGGVNAINFGAKIRAMQASWLVRYIKDEDAPWKAAVYEEIRSRLAVLVRRIAGDGMTVKMEGTMEVASWTLPAVLPVELQEPPRASPVRVIRNAFKSWALLGLTVTAAAMPKAREVDEGGRSTTRLDEDASIHNVVALQCACRPTQWFCPLNTKRKVVTCGCRVIQLVLNKARGSDPRDHLGVPTVEGRWARVDGHLLHHQMGGRNARRTVPMTRCTVKAVYWKIVEERWRTPASVAKWREIAERKKWPAIKLQSLFRGIVPKVLQWKSYNINFSIAHRILPVNHLRQKWAPAAIPPVGSAPEMQEELGYRTGGKRKVVTPEPRVTRKARRGSGNTKKEAWKRWGGQSLPRSAACRLCAEKDESVCHVVAECTGLADGMWRWAIQIRARIDGSGFLPGDIPASAKVINCGVGLTKIIGPEQLLLCSVRAAIATVHLGVGGRSGWSPTENERMRVAKHHCQSMFRYTVWREWEKVLFFLGPKSPSIVAGAKMKEDFTARWMSTGSKKKFVKESWEIFVWEDWPP